MTSENNLPAPPITESLQIGEVQVFVQGEGETILMIHGWPDNYRLWDAQVEALSLSYRCVRFTLPGFDRQHKRRMYLPEDIFSVISQVVAATAKGEPVTLLLHDWGCIWGYQYYLRNPDAVRRIVGVDVGDAGSPELLAELGFRGRLFTMAYQLWLALAWKLGGGLGDAMTRRIARMAGVRVPGEQIFSGMNYSYYFFWSRLLTRRKTGLLPVRIDCPFLFVFGSKKASMFHSSQWAEKVKKGPKNQVVSLPTGHWVTLQDTDRFNRLVLDWLGRTSSTGSEIM